MQAESKKWVAAWGNAVSIAEHRPESYSKNITLRYPIAIPFDGEKLRFTFDNYCGTEPITISSATVSLVDSTSNPYKDLSCPIAENSIRDITFGETSSTDVSIPSQQRVVSNPVDFPVKSGMTVCVSIYFKDYTLMQSAVLITGALSKGFFSFGDQTHSTELPIMQTKTTNWFYFLSNMDIYTTDNNHAVICYGDSITSQDWPDELKLRLAHMGCCHTSIIRRAASGTRILREYACITYDSYGLKGKNRFPHEIPTSGADTLIIQQGINDIIHPVGAEINVFRPMSDLPTADELISGYRWYIQQAKELGLVVYLGTLLPIWGWRTYAPFRESLRNEVNEWIRDNPYADGCIDFDAAVRNQERPLEFAPGFDSGDHLHPSRAAYAAMAMAVPDHFLR